MCQFFMVPSPLCYHLLSGRYSIQKYGNSAQASITLAKLYILFVPSEDTVDARFLNIP